MDASQFHNVWGTGGAVPAAPETGTRTLDPKAFESTWLKEGPKAPAASQPSWQDVEALENAAAAGIKLKLKLTPAAEPKKGRGIGQALLDYPGHVVRGFVDTLAAPGNALASNAPSTSEGLIPAATGLAGLAIGSTLPRVSPAAVIERAAPGSRAVNSLVEAVGPENIPDVVNRLRSNPRLTVADVSDPARTMVQGLIDPAQPKVQQLVAERVKERHSTLPSAVNSAYTEAMGPAPNVVQMVEGLKQRASDAGQGIIEPAVKGAKPVDVTPVVAAIDKEIAADPVGKATLRALKAGEEPTLPLSDYQRRLFQLRQDLRGSWSDRDQMFLDASGEQGAHRIQTELRAEAQNLLNSASGAERSLGARLMGMRGRLVDQIDEAAGGAYKPGLQKFRDAKEIHEAFDAGFDTLKNRAGVAGLQDRPEALKQWMSAATPEEVVARRIGTRADIDQKIRAAKNQALAGESITRIEYNQEKLRTLFGEKEANRLIRVMKDAQDEAATNAKLLHGSKTAETLAGRDALKVRNVEAGNSLHYAVPFMTEMLATQYGVPGAGAALLGLKGLHVGAQKIGQIADVSRNYQFARSALATGAERDATIRSLLSHPKVRELNKRSNALAVP